MKHGNRRKTRLRKKRQRTKEVLPKWFQDEREQKKQTQETKTQTEPQGDVKKKNVKS